jgi:hypothetical protein
MLTPGFRGLIRRRLRGGVSVLVRPGIADLPGKDLSGHTRVMEVVSGGSRKTDACFLFAHPRLNSPSLLIVR